MERVAVRRRLGTLVACLVVSAVASTALPQAAYATTNSGHGGKGIVDTVKGWFGDGRHVGGHRLVKPLSHDELDVADRQKLPRGKAEPQAKRIRELKGRRTSTARFWQLSDGRVQAELSAVPTVYRSGSGRRATWKPIDTAVHATDTKGDAKGFDFANTTNEGWSWFGSDADHLVRFQSPDGHSVTLGLEGATGALKPVVKGSKVTYKDAVNGADLEYGVGRGRVKENITLAERPHGPLKFTFTLDTDGLTPRARKDGSVALYGELPHTPVMVIPAPFMTDAKKADKSVFGETYSRKVTQRLTKEGRSWKLTVTPDAKWLASKERRYPVVIDPTITIAPSPSDSQDAMVLSDQPSVNFNSDWRLSVGRTNTGIARSLIKFPLSEIPANTKIDSARLEMYYDQSHTTAGTNVLVDVHRATGPWDESQANWTNTSSLVGEESGTTVQVDDGDADTTAATGSWPASNSSLTQYGVGGDYHYNKDTVAGDTYTWQPRLPESSTYRVDVHYVAASDRVTAAPYTVTGTNGSTTYTVDQTSGTQGVWTSLNSGNQIQFSKGTAGKVVLGDGPVTGSTVAIADAVRWVNPAQLTRTKGDYNTWDRFPVTDTVQQWVNGTAPNYGFVLKADDESANGPLGGPLYEAGDGYYGGETSTIPRLTVTYGKVGTTLDSPTVIHSTGPELSWKAYSNTTGDSGLDIVEYQLHRSTQQAFTPSAATLVAPIDKLATAYTDTTATPTPDSSSAEIGRSYYYQLAVKTKSGELLGSPTRIVGIPKAGRTMRLLQGTDEVTDSTLSSTQPATNQDAMTSWGVGQHWLEVGNNSSTWGTTRAAMKFDTSAIPTTATVLESRLFMWGAETDTDTNGAIYELHGLTKDFAETSATWNNATSTTAWTKPGGDFSSTVSDTVPQVSEVGRHWWDATSLTQGWTRTPSSNHGALVKLADETSSGPQERTVFLSSEADDYQLGPLLRVIYVDSTTDDTYYAPTTPARMTPNSTYTVDFTVTNTTSSAWAAGERVLSYTWKLPDGTDMTTGGNQLTTAIPALASGASATIHAQVKTPINSDSGSKRTSYVLGWDVKKVSDGSWLSAGTAGIPPLKQNVAVEDPTSNALGLEKFYSYTGKNTGAGSTLMNNLASGNSVWSYNAFSNPGRGLTTFARFAYNSLDTDNPTGGAGAGWSMQVGGPIRLGAALDFHPNPNPTEIRLPDGDGTTHTFTKQADGSWKAPAGVHYRITAKTGLDCTPDKDPIPDAWTLLRPDGTRFFFGCDGYLTSVVDKNGNTQTYTYELHKNQGKAAKFLAYVTDPAGRQSLTLDYYKRGDASYDYIDATGAKGTGSNLTNPDIYDHVKSMTDISGRKISIYYTDKGLLGQFTDGDGSTQPKNFKFTYDAIQGNKNVKLVKVTDPRGHATQLSYYAPQTGDDPKYHWWTKTITDRLNGDTGFAYAADTANTKFTDTTVTDAETHATKYVTDDFGRPVQTTNAKSQTTKMSWDADNNVTYLEEDNGAKTAYCYDQKTGYPLWQRDAENNKAGVPDQTTTCVPDTSKWPANASKYEYQTRADGFSADLFRKTSPEGRAWQFGYDSFGNLKTVTDPKGLATTTVGDYTTSYEYNSYGELTKATDANSHSTVNSDFDPNGYPKTITDALQKSTSYVYDDRGQVTSVTDALGKTTTQTYDTFGRPLVNTVPKEQGVVITTPAPVYDANDNVTRSTAPDGAVSTAVYDDTDQVTSATAPANNQTDPRTTSYTYDKVGDLKTTTEPKGTATTSDTTDYITTNSYDEIYRLTSVVNAKGDKVSYEYDDVGNVTKVIDPKKNATTDTTDYTTKTDYDLDHRVTVVTDAAGKTSKKGYDKDGLVTSATDAENNTTLVTYDERGKTTQVQVPHDGTSTISYRTTKYEYDQVGNTTKVITPRAVAAGTTTAFTARTDYDELNRPIKQYQPYDPADSRYNNANVYTQTTYDEVGRVSKTSLPPSEGETVRNDTKYSYFDNGWVRSSTDPWDIATTYEYNDLGQQTKRTLTSAGGSSDRTMTWSYYPDGSLKSRADDGVPAGKSVVLVDNSDTQNTSKTGTWTKGDATNQQGYNHETHAAGTGTDAFTWTLNIPKDGTYAAYVKFPTVTGAATTAKYTLTYDGGTVDKTIDQSATANQGTWVSLGSYAFKQGNAAKLQLFQNSGGVVAADAVKLVRDTTGDPADTEKDNFAYSYDLNGNLTQIDDTSSTAKIDSYAITYTGLNQVQKVTENLAGTEKKATSYTYDANGKPDTITHPDQFSKYTYDLRDLVKTVSVGKSATDASPKVTSYTYTDRGQQLQETKANGNTVDYTYYLDAALKTSTEKKPNGTLVSSHTYAYDANGNKSQDVAKKMNADNHTAYLDSTTNYTYDPANRLKQSTKTGNGAGTETYVHDDNANVISQTVGSTTTTFDYDRNRLLTATAGGSTARYNYDPFGRQESVTQASDGKIISRNVYDGFDHVVESQKADSTGALKSTTYTFDPLDRTTSQTANGKTTDYEYLGLSSKVLDEKVAGTLTKSYQYSPWGERLSQIKYNSDGTTEDGYYGYNSHSDVETLTDKNGDTKATYGYTAYGSDDKSEFTGIDKPDTADPTKEAYNPYRFNAKRWDAQSGTYDMGFRDYDPGLNRFTSRDMYTGALADMNLGADPYTGNRYAFAGGNPSSFIELDGHRLVGEDGFSGSAEEIEAHERSLAAAAAKANPDGLKLLTDPAEVPEGLDVMPEGMRLAGGEQQYQKALEILHAEYEKKFFNYSNYTAIASRVNVRVGGNGLSRTVVFLSSKAQPKQLQGMLDELEDNGIVVIQAAPGTGRSGKGHAEGAAAALRNSPELQEEWLGGRITRVYSALSAIKVCSEKCGEDLTEFIGEEGVNISEDDSGLLEGGIYTTEKRLENGKFYGTPRVFEQAMNAMEQGRLGFLDGLEAAGGEMPEE
ncbi:golvesin C-terminal-like domain-containing protein [Streptomyces sp. NPDC002671]